jgi:ATP-dependent Clp protease ATP-binding subunit ClpA
VLKQVLVSSARKAIPQYRQFEVEARRSGARFIEAEHMLLSLAASRDTEAARLLLDSGLGHERLTAALRDEHRQSLAFAGLNPTAASLPEATELDRPISMGTSAKTALGRAVHGSREQRSRRARLESMDVLIGILMAELGTVPRALAIAGVDRAALLARARASVGLINRPC